MYPCLETKSRFPLTAPLIGRCGNGPMFLEVFCCIFFFFFFSFLVVLGYSRFSVSSFGLNPHRFFCTKSVVLGFPTSVFSPRVVLFFGLALLPYPVAVPAPPL